MWCSGPFLSGWRRRVSALALSSAPIVAPLLLTGVAVDCARPPVTEITVNDSVYVEVMTRLALFREDLLESRGGLGYRVRMLDSLEIAVAEEFGVTAEDLFAFSEVAGRDPERMKKLWELVLAAVDSLRPPEAEAEAEAEAEQPEPDVNPASRTLGRDG